MTDQSQAQPSDPQAAIGGAPYAAPQRPLPLRQMGIGELIDGSVKLYRRDWLALVGIAAFVLIPFTLIQVWVTQGLVAQVDPTVFDESLLTDILIVSLVFIVIQFLIVQPFLVAAMTRAAADAYLGEQVSIGRVSRYALSKLPAILWISVQTLVATLIGFLLLVIPGIIIAVRLTLAPPVLVVEDIRGSSALGRSWRLTEGHAWRVFGALVLAALITAIGAAIITIPTELIAAMLPDDGWIVSTLGTMLATVLITPFSILIVVLLYFDLRVRKEGFDIELMAQELAATS
jgi:hypothetical protein